MSGRTGSRAKYSRPLRELAGMVGVSPDTLTANIAKGAPAPPKTARGDLASWAASYHEWRKVNVGTFQQEQQRAARDARDAEEDGHRREYQKWRAAEARLRVARETRQVVSRKEVAEFVTRAFLAFKQRLVSIVPKMTVRLENQPGHVIHEELTAEIDDILNGLSRGLERANEASD